MHPTRVRRGHPVRDPDAGPIAAEFAPQKRPATVFSRCWAKVRDCEPGTVIALLYDMTMKRALQLILGVSFFGVVFSGVLSWQEVFMTSTAAACPSPGCVYGFFVYVLIASIAFWGLLSGNRDGVSTPTSG